MTSRNLSIVHDFFSVVVQEQIDIVSFCLLGDYCVLHNRQSLTHGIVDKHCEKDLFWREHN